ncbi:MAG: FAD-dependent thymidylate synthase, partial [Cyanobacteria bacterium J06639_1]
QDYSSEFVSPASDIPEHYGEAVVKHLLKGNRGHYGPLEHPQITFAVGHFPHTVMQQARTHRVGVSFDVQSLRYTGNMLNELGEFLRDREMLDEASQSAIRKLFYVPETIEQGEAKTRQGMQPIAPEALEIILEQYRQQAIAYHRLVHECGVPYEDARHAIGYGIRQHFIVSFNCRSLMHFLDLRAKFDAQGEIQHLCELMLPHFQAWCPHVAEWYAENRWGKARLAP